LNNKILFSALFIITALLWGCGSKSDQEIFYSTQKHLNKIESYTCEIEITTYGNKSPQQYVMKQWFKKPDKYKLEVIWPESLKGKTTISDGTRAWIHHPGINQSWTMEKFLHSEEQNMFLGYFIKNCLESEGVELEKKVIDREKYLRITTDIPGNHAYYHRESLYINTKTKIPHLLQVYDAKGQLRIEVRYNTFEYNPPLEDGIFWLNSKDGTRNK